MGKPSPDLIDGGSSSRIAIPTCVDGEPIGIRQNSPVPLTRLGELTSKEEHANVRVEIRVHIYCTLNGDERIWLGAVNDERLMTMARWKTYIFLAFPQLSSLDFVLCRPNTCPTRAI
jgi:hypothetical protein